MGERTRRLLAAAASGARKLTRRPVVILGLAIALVGAGLAVGVGSRSDLATVEAGSPSTTVPSLDDDGLDGLIDVTSTTTSPSATSTTSTDTSSTSTTARTTIPTSPSGPSRRVAADPKGRWTLELTAAGCIDLVLKDSRHNRLMCDAQAPTKPIGVLMALSTSIGRMAVAIAQPDVTGFDAAPQCAGAFHYDAAAGRHPDRADRAFVAGLIAPCGTSATVHAGPHTVARLTIPEQDRTYASLDQRTDPPYGRWKGFRKVGQSGYYMGGHQIVGFYDGSSGPCFLYRRLGGSDEKVIADGCPTGGAAIQVATLSPLSLSDPSGRAFSPAAVTNERDAVLHIELPNGEKRTLQSQASPDTSSAWIALTQFASHVSIPAGVTEVSFVVTRHGSELARVQVPVPS